VDDEPQLLFSVTEFLTRVGYEVTPAESGGEALEHLVDLPPDLIISDIMMEEMDGYEFQQRVNALTGGGIPFIFLSAKTELNDRLVGLRGGADDYVTKPFEPEELEARIASVFSRIDQIRREEQRDVDSLRTQIVSAVSSRLRSPVTNLMAHMNLVLNERFGDSLADQERFLKSALEDANALCELVNDLSWAANDQPQEVSIKREPIRVAPVVRSSAARAARIAADKSINLGISCGGLLSGNLDGAAMTQALSGLLEAAVEMSPTGTQVSISATRAREGGIEFMIADGGMDSEAQYVDSTALAEAVDHARRVIKAHAGKVSSERDDAGRQSFVIWIPGRVAKHVGRRR